MVRKGMDNDGSAAPDLNNSLEKGTRLGVGGEGQDRKPANMHSRRDDVALSLFDTAAEEAANRKKLPSAHKVASSGGTNPDFKPGEASPENYELAHDDTMCLKEDDPIARGVVDGDDGRRNTDHKNGSGSGSGSGSDSFDGENERKPEQQPGRRWADYLHSLTEEEMGELTGTTLDNRYRVGKLLGAGAMGSAYEALHMRLNVKKVVKVLHPHVAKNNEADVRLRQEGMAAEKINHHNVVRVTDAGDGYIVMDLVKGEELDSVIKKRGKLPWNEASKIALGITKGMQAAHNEGVVHRDLKPSNVMMDKTNKPRVLDFGIAKLKTNAIALTATDAMIGTPIYMAPEQYEEAENVDHRADIYSLGAIMYEMLIGEAPFTGRNAVELLNNVMGGVKFHEEDDVSQLSKDLILKAMAKKPEDRFQSMDEMGEDIQQIGSDGGFVLNPHTNKAHREPGRHTQLQHIQKVDHRNRNLAIVGGGAALVASLAAAGYFVLKEPNPDTPPESDSTGVEVRPESLKTQASKAEKKAEPIVKKTPAPKVEVKKDESEAKITKEPEVNTLPQPPAVPSRAKVKYTLAPKPKKKSAKKKAKRVKKKKALEAPDPFADDKKKVPKKKAPKRKTLKKKKAPKPQAAPDPFANRAEYRTLFRV